MHWYQWYQYWSKWNTAVDIIIIINTMANIEMEMPIKSCMTNHDCTGQSIEESEEILSVM